MPYSHLLEAYGFDGRTEHPKGAGQRLVEAGSDSRRVSADLLARQAEAAAKKGDGGRGRH